MTDWMVVDPSVGNIDYADSEQEAVEIAAKWHENDCAEVWIFQYKGVYPDDYVQGEPFTQEQIDEAIAEGKELAAWLQSQDPDGPVRAGEAGRTDPPAVTPSTTTSAPDTGDIT